MKKKNNHNFLKVIYFLCAIIVLIAGIYYEKGYTDINKFINDMKEQATKAYTEITDNISNAEDTKSDQQKTTFKVVNGNLEMHIIDVGQRR